MSGAPRYFGTDGIRGEADQGLLTPAVFTKIGAALGAALCRARSSAQSGASARMRPLVAIARDTRVSGPALCEAFARGVASAGADVLDLGVAPTPVLADAILRQRAAAGAVVSASHNPPADNGIKLFDSSATKIDESTELMIEQWIDDESAGAVDTSSASAITTATIARPDFETTLGGYQERLAEHLIALQGSDVDLRGMKIAIDCAEGAASAFAPRVLAARGAQVAAIASSGQGARINVDSGALHPERLAKLVKDGRAAIGLAFDGDADRLILVDESGVVRHGDAILFVLAQDLAERGLLARNRIAGTVMTNLGLEHALAARGIAVVRTPVGDRYVAQAMEEQGLVLGGEQSGHVILRGPPPVTGDALLAALHVLQVMKRSGKTLGDLCRGLALYPQILRNVAVAEKRPFAEIPGLLAAISDAEAKLDGRGRVLLRYSGTERKARVMVEAEEGMAIEEIAEILSRAISANTR